MNARRALSLALTVFVLTALPAAVFAQQGQPVAGYKLLTTISIPGGLTGFDISWVDSAAGKYYLADRGNATASPVVPPRIDVIDTVNDQFVTSINLPAGANGIVSVPRAHEIWVGLSDSTTAVVSTDDYTIRHIISNGGKARADELAYDPEDRIILIANDRDTPPFITFIDAKSYTVLKTVNYDGVSAPQTTNGLEQPVWDQATLKFYLAVPATKANPNGEIDEIDPLTYSVTRSFPTACKGPAGLALIPNQRLITSCGDILDIATGSVLVTVSGVGADEIWYSPGDQRVYFGGYQSINVPVVDARINATGPVAMLVIGHTVPTGQTGVAQTTHSIAADEVNRKVFIPVSNAGVQVWRNGSTVSAGPNPVIVPPGSY